VASIAQLVERRTVENIYVIFRLRPRAAFSSPRSQFFTIRTDPKPVNNLFIYFFQTLKRKKTHGKTLRHASVTVTAGRDRKIRTALRTNQIAGFVTVPAWKEIKIDILMSQVRILLRCFFFLCKLPSSVISSDLSLWRYF